MLKMLVSDYDSTFYIDDNDIKKNVLLVEEFMKSNLFVISTGRSYLDFLKKEHKYNIKYSYLIINHGATIIKDNKIIYNKCLNNEIKDQIINKLDFSKIVNYFSCSCLESRVGLDNSDITKINIEYNTVSEAREVYAYLMQYFSSYIKIFLVCHDKALEIVSNEVDKSSALKFLQKILKMSIKDIYVIGDNYTDLEMIKDFNGYCMKNSVEILKNVSNGQYKSVSDLIIDINTGII